ncbi:MAG: hypothetical protein IJD75_00660 [Clostridia bacterium]|nr:hypothetical protein [Clostridia bacterium]
MKKAPQKLLTCALLVVCANIAIPHGVQYVCSNFGKGADQKFFAELFFKKATSRARRRPSAQPFKKDIRLLKTLIGGML